MMMDTNPIIPLDYLLSLKAFKKVRADQVTSTIAALPTLPFCIHADGGVQRTRAFAAHVLTSADFLVAKVHALQGRELRSYNAKKN